MWEFEEDNIAYVIHDTLTNEYLDRDDFFTTKLKRAKTYHTEDSAVSAMSNYIKIYKHTNRKATTEHLNIVPIGLKKLTIKS